MLYICKKVKAMKTATVKKKRVSAAAARRAKRAAEYVPPKRLSKAALFMRKHPEGLFEVVDWRAVMK